MKHLALTQPALNVMVKLPGGSDKLRQARRDAQKLLDRVTREHTQQVADMDGLIKRLGIALGEVQA